MKRVAVVASAAATLLLALGSAQAYWNWADEFTSANVTLRAPSSTGTWTIRAFWDSLDSHENAPWEQLGAQYLGASENAVDKVQFDFRETYDGGCGSVTVQVSRWRDTTPPAIGSTCSSASATGNPFVGSVSYTVNSCGGGNADDTYSHRLLPAFNFAAEQGNVSVGSVVGYLTRIRMSSAGGISISQNPADAFGCYRIWWFAQ